MCIEKAIKEGNAGWGTGAVKETVRTFGFVSISPESPEDIPFLE